MNEWINVKLSDQNDRQTYVNEEPVILFQLSGYSAIQLNESVRQLKEDSYLVINAKEPYRLRVSSEGVVFQLSLFMREAMEGFPVKRWKINCSSEDPDAESVRELLVQICGCYFAEKDASTEEAKHAAGVFLLRSTYYQLLHCIAENHLIFTQERKEKTDRDEDRMQYIRMYISENYNREIGLAEIAEKLYCTPSYLSKYIKRKFGQNFKDLLIRERLAHCMPDIENSEKTFLKIAMDHGFPGIVAFNRAFRETYQMLPSQYRKQYRTERQNRNELTESAEQKLKKLMETGRKPEETDKKPEKLSLDLENTSPLIKNACRMINAGAAKDLLRADMQRHMKYLHETLGFTYVRFWDIYAPEMYLFDQEQREYNFSKLDSIIDFLEENQMHPYMELGFKPNELLRDVGNYLVSQKSRGMFQTLEAYGEFLDQMIRHFVNRYGLETVEQWYFEVWKIPQDGVEEYLHIFTTVKKCMRRIAGGCRVGGAGLNRNQGQTLREMLAAWSRCEQKPDFLSLYSYPYRHDRLDSQEMQDQKMLLPTGVPEYEVYSRDPDYLYHYLEEANAALQEYGMSAVELHVSEWNFTVSNRNFMNDSIFKGAYVVKNLMDNIQCCAVIGYWFGSDLFSEYYDTKALLTGGGGLLSKDGICKPAFYGMMFMKRLEHLLIGKSKHAIVTTNGHDSYSVVCHHCQNPKIGYYMKAQSDISVEEMKEYFSEKTLKVQLAVHGVKNGTYLIKRRVISAQYGSVLDEWQRMGLTDALSSHDIAYLKQICVPRISMEKCVITDQCLRLETSMQTNEIQHIHITYQL